jgi:hypothetical protein
MASVLASILSRNPIYVGRCVTFDHAPGAPARTKTHRSAILALLRERGARGVLASELYDSPYLYGRSPRNRISELRKEGYPIEGAARGGSDWHYWLQQGNPQDPKPPESWQDRPRATGLPLFDSVVRD